MKPEPFGQVGKRPTCMTLLITYTCEDFVSADISKLGECEFSLISEMNSQMIIHHPYRTLTDLQSTFSMTQEEAALAWSIINDHYMTDLPLLFAPHIIAITGILLALVLRPTTNNLSTTSHSAASMSGAVQAALGPANLPQKPGPSTDKPGAIVRTKVQKLTAWLAESNVDIEAMIDCTQEIISFYDVQEQYNDKLTKEQITRFVKARGLDK